jgi:hypothetical protein
MKYLVLLVLYVALVSYCVTDVANRTEREPFGLHKALWVVFIVVVPFVGGVFWLVARRREGRRYGGSAPTAPDDDPEYLRWLRDQQRRKGE